MKLLEYRGKQLLKNVGIRIPPSIVTNNKSYINLRYHKNIFQEFFYEHKAVFIKAQIPYGYRKKHGLIKDSGNYREALEIIDDIYNKDFMNQPISTLLIEKKLDIAEEYYVAVIYDTESRQPTIIFSTQGGIDIEDVLSHKEPYIYYVSILDGLHDYQAREIAINAGISGRDIFAVSKFIELVYKCFIQYDCKALEINPIIKAQSGLLFAGDAKITIDDNSISRNDIFADITTFEDRRLLTKMEADARRIDLRDYRGVAGKSFKELNGDIAILASGGGVSLTCMDALIQAGGQPANYTEYSGNPPREKVMKLTKITLSKNGLNGCLVIGGTANFTDVFETLSGFADGLLKLSSGIPDFPIVIRRAGPNADKAFEMLKIFAKKHKVNLFIYGEETPMTEAVKIMVEKVFEYKKTKGNQ